MTRLKRMGLILLITGLFTSALFASMTRTDNLGYQTNLYLLDSYNIWSFPSTLVLFSNQIHVESLIGNQLYRGGANLPLSPNLTGGFYLTNSTRSIAFANPDQSARTASHQADLFLAHRGVNTAWGAQLSYYQTKNTVNDLTELNNDMTTSQNFIGLTFGVSYFRDTQAQFDGAIYIGLANFENNPVSDQYQGEGNTQIGAGLRYFYSLSSRSVIVPFAGLMIEGSGYTFSILNQTSSAVQKSNSYLFGIAHQYIPTRNTLVILAIGYTRTSETSDIKMGGSSVPTPTSVYEALPFLSLGLENRLFRWLTVRFGFYELLGKSTIETPAFSEVSSTSSMYTPYFGLAFHLKRFIMDAHINHDFLHHGPYVLTGQNYGSFIYQFSITYNIP
jgi:hypothetical protein